MVEGASLYSSDQITERILEHHLMACSDHQMIQKPSDRRAVQR